MEEGSMNDLLAFRKELHKYPEVSGKELETQRRILDFLRHNGIVARAIGEMGVIVVFDSGVEGKSIMLRSDHDALPIQEINEFEHKSVNEGVSHKCGHDGHTAIMCGVAQHFKNSPLKKGKLILIFQPAEENGEGAKAVLQDTAFTFTPDIVFALHNLPGYPLHEIVCKEGSFTASARSIVLKINGKTSHAAEPEKGINPANAISDFVKMFEDEAQPDLESDDFALTTPIHLNMGEKSYGVSAGYGELHYTLRTWTSEVMRNLTNRLEKRIKDIADEYEVAVEIGYTQEFDSNMNDRIALEYIASAAKSNNLKYTQRAWPFKWGEDFGLFTQRYPGAMFGIGSGESSPALHNPDYDFPDEITGTGIKMFTTIVEKVISE